MPRMRVALFSGSTLMSFVNIAHLGLLIQIATIGMTLPRIARAAGALGLVQVMLHAPRISPFEFMNASSFVISDSILIWRFAPTVEAWMTDSNR
jgi:hypothetical protein